MQTPFVSIVVANWEGAEWIARALSSLQISARASGHSHEIIVVDDASVDDSARIIRERFPRVRLIVNERNAGFGASTMRGVRASRGRVLVLCNNDLVVKEQFVPNLVRWFEKPKVTMPNGFSFRRAKLFGVSAKTVSWYDGQANQLCMGARWKGGRITAAWSNPEEAMRCLFLQAGAAAYNRSHFLKLGGLSPLFAPGYWEDYDLSYRAAKAGLVNIYDPDALALHHGGGSMQRRFGGEGVERLKTRNHLLFEWMNLSDAPLLASYAARMGYGVLREWMRGENPRLTRGLLDALPMFPAALRGRLLRANKISDRELMNIVRDARASF